MLSSSIMDIDAANEIIECLPQGETRFFYAPETRACRLLAQFIGDAMSIADIKRSPYAKLLQRPEIKNIIAQCGDGRLRREQLEIQSAENYLFLLGLDTYGDESGDQHRWAQLVRRGHNLVLQLNLSCEHDVYYKRLIKSHRHQPFNYGYHPTHDYYNSLAWSRLDVDLEGKQAFIEEIQSDFIREVNDIRKGKKQNYRGKECWYSQFGYNLGHCDDVWYYMYNVAEPYVRIWQDAMMQASIWFLHHELGIETIYMHSHKTVNRLKECDAPRSLYNELPKRFCFQTAHEVPNFLKQDCSGKSKRIMRQQGLWKLQL